MEQIKEQVAVAIQGAKSILLLTHTSPDADAFGSVLGLGLALQKMGKKVSAVSYDHVPRDLMFLPQVEQISSKLSGSRDLILQIDQSQRKIQSISYNKEGGKVNIIITPLTEEIREGDTKFIYGDYNFDLIIALDCGAEHLLGPIYSEHRSLFETTSFINIDHHQGNPNFAKINWVDTEATSTARMVYELITRLEGDGSIKLFDKNIATNLLAGLMFDTGAFRHGPITPQILDMAAQLVEMGADRELIVKNLFKSKPLPTVKIWGKILSEARFEPGIKLIWSTISLADFDAFGSEERSTEGVINEVLSGVEGAEIAVVLSEKEPRKIFGSVRTVKGVDGAAIAKLFNGGGHTNASGFQVEDVAFEEIEDKIIAKIRAHLKGGAVDPIVPSAREARGDGFQSVRETLNELTDNDEELSIKNEEGEEGAKAATAFRSIGTSQWQNESDAESKGSGLGESDETIGESLKNSTDDAEGSEVGDSIKVQMPAAELIS